MTKRPRFQELQYQFAGHIRDPEQAPAPADVEPRRMQVYTELFYNNVEDFLASSFPVLREVTADDHWQALVRDYFARHRAKTPLFPELPREFLYYLEHERGAVAGDLPFQLELAHYEWIESALYLAEESAPRTGYAADGDLLHGLPVFTSALRLLEYRYPVHRICRDYLPEEAPEQPTALLVYRDAAAAVQYLELNPVTLYLLRQLHSGQPPSTAAVLDDIVSQLAHAQPEAVINGGLEILEELRRRGAVLGSRQP